MKEISNNTSFNLILLFTIVGEFFLPWILKYLYVGYNSKTMVMSVLGSPQSPVRTIYNLWLIWLGCFLTFTAIVYYFEFKKVSLTLAILLFLSISIFAFGAGVLSGIFSVNEKKELNTLASKIHGIGAAIGFMALLFFPLLNGIAAFKQADMKSGILCTTAFIGALISFSFFIMGDKAQFKNTIFSYEGLWERVTLFFMYIPFIYKAMNNIMPVR